MKISKKKLLAIIGFCFVIVALNVGICCHRSAVSGTYQLAFRLKGTAVAEIQLFRGIGGSFSEADSQIQTYNGEGWQEMSFSFLSGADSLRLDFGDGEGQFQIADITVSYQETETTVVLDDGDVVEHAILREPEEDGSTLLIAQGEDPYLVMTLDTSQMDAAVSEHQKMMDLILNGTFLLLLDGGLVAAFFFRKKVFSLPLELYQNRGLIFSLAKNDFKTKYAGSYLGIVWAFVQPVVTILVYWFVFSVGLKAGNVMEYPFVLYLITGIVPWFFFQDALNGGTNALIEYNYLVKKVVFKISILPIVKIISALFVHGFFVLFTLIISALYGYLPSLYTLQIVYYSFCTFLLALGLVYATSAIVVFFRDLTQIISIVLQVGIWLTPIMWDLTILSDYPVLMKLFKLNPMYYIVSGYRDSILGQVAVTQHWGWTLYFWVFTIALFGLGTVVFKRLKPHFADVL